MPKIVGASRKSEPPLADDGVGPEGSEGEPDAEIAVAATSKALEGAALGAEFTFGYGSDLPAKGGPAGVEAGPAGA